MGRRRRIGAGDRWNRPRTHPPRRRVRWCCRGARPSTDAPVMGILRPFGRQLRDRRKPRPAYGGGLEPRARVRALGRSTGWSRRGMPRRSSSWTSRPPSRNPPADAFRRFAAMAETAQPSWSAAACRRRASATACWCCAGAGWSRTREAAVAAGGGMRARGRAGWYRHGVGGAARGRALPPRAPGSGATGAAVRSSVPGILHYFAGPPRRATDHGTARSGPRRTSASPASLAAVPSGPPPPRAEGRPRFGARPDVGARPHGASCRRYARPPCGRKLGRRGSWVPRRGPFRSTGAGTAASLRPEILEFPQRVGQHRKGGSEAWSFCRRSAATSTPARRRSSCCGGSGVLTRSGDPGHKANRLFGSGLDPAAGPRLHRGRGPALPAHRSAAPGGPARRARPPGPARG